MLETNYSYTNYSFILRLLDIKDDDNVYTLEIILETHRMTTIFPMKVPLHENILFIEMISLT